MKMVDHIDQARLSRDYQALVDVIPYASFLGLAIERHGDELLTVVRYDDKLVGDPQLPALHGGVLGSLLESAAIFQVLSEAEIAAVPKTITVTVDYLRSARPLDTFARGFVTRHGRRVVNVRVEAWQDDRARLVATANVHLLVRRGP